MVDAWDKPVELSDLDVVFPKDISNLLPEYKEIPVEYRRSKMPGNKIFNYLFFSTGEVTLDDFVARPGIDRDDALRHLLSVMRSYEPKHEHKEAACAYLMSLWFEPIKLR